MGDVQQRLVSGGSWGLVAGYRIPTGNIGHVYIYSWPLWRASVPDKPCQGQARHSRASECHLTGPQAPSCQRQGPNQQVCCLGKHLKCDSGDGEDASDYAINNQEADHVFFHCCGSSWCWLWVGACLDGTVLGEGPSGLEKREMIGEEQEKRLGRADLFKKWAGV